MQHIFKRPSNRRWFTCILLAALAIGNQVLDANSPWRTPAISLLTDPAAPVPNAISNAPNVGHEALCQLCADPPGVPIVHLTAADAESIAAEMSVFNESLLAHMDSLFKSGTFGKAGGREAKRTVRLLTRMMSINSMHYMVKMSTNPDVIYEANEEVLKGAFAKYADAGVYPIVAMKRGRMGLGQICVKYDLSQDLETQMKIGGEMLRIRVAETQFKGQTRRMLIMYLPTLLFSTIEVLFDEHFTARAEFIRSPGPPSPYDLYLIYSMHGMYVRKWGVHEPKGMMFWSSPRDVARTTLPRNPLVGSCVYVPGVQLKLPSFLPDMSFEDLRAVDLPQPILDHRFIESKAYPRWLRRSSKRGFKNWETHGPIPPDLRIRFPDS